MRHIRSAIRRVAGLFTRDSAREFREEMETHLEMAVADGIRRGLSRDEARRRALLVSGGVTQAVEAVRDQHGLPWLENFVDDIRYAARSLRHSAVFTAVVVITLALGIGANTAIFSVVRAVLLKPLPHRGGDRLVYLRQSAAGAGQSSLTFSVPEVRDLRAGVSALAGIAEYSSSRVIHLTKDGPVRIDVGLVTGNYFDVMGLSPIVGRVTGRGDDGPTAERVAVLTYEYWMNRFGGDPGVVGTRITLDKRPVTVVGVLQPAPFFPQRVEMLLNLVNSEHHMGASMQFDRTHRMTEVVARVKPDATIDQARSQATAIYAAMKAQFKDAYPAAGNYRLTVIPFKEVLGERAKLTLWILMAAAAFVLVVSAANVTNLTLMRGIRRDHELVVRTALGAGVARLRRLLLVENLILTTLGASLGVAIAKAGVGALATFAARYSQRASDIRLDGVVFGFALLLAVGLALVLSFLASIPGEGEIASRILSGGQRASAGASRLRVQRGLVVIQIAVTAILLTGASLLTRTLIQLSRVETGLTTEDVLSMQVTLLSRSELQDSSATAAAWQRLQEMRDEIAALPGVLAVGIGGTAPLRKEDFFNLLQAEGRPTAPGDAIPRAEFRGANPEFFRAAGIPLLEGRPFASSDVDRDGVIINKALADRLFGNQNPVGKRIAWKMDWRPDDWHWLTVQGVVGTTRDGGPDAEPRPVLFQRMSQMPVGNAALVIRSNGHAADLAKAATRIVRQVAPATLIEDVMTISQYRDQNISPRRLNAVLISSFSAVAIIIAAVGIAGVLAFSVGARTKEIGVRMSFGADSGRVQRMILREGGMLVASGLTLGIIGAYVLAGVIRGLLFGVHPHDPMTFICVTVLMTSIAMLSCWIPALRAARIDPAVSLRA